MIGGLTSASFYSSATAQPSQNRPDFGALDSNQSGGLSRDELKSGLSNGAFSGGPSSQGAREGGRPPPPPPPPPGGGEGGLGNAGPDRSSSVSARLLQGALELLSSDDADTAIDSLFAAMDVDSDGSITGGEFHEFGKSLGGPPAGGPGGSVQSQGTQAASAATALYGQYQSLDTLMSLASEVTQMRL